MNKYVRTNMWSMIITALLSLIITLSCFGYESIISRIDKMETSIKETSTAVNENIKQITRNDERIKAVYDKIDELKGR